MSRNSEAALQRGLKAATDMVADLKERLAPVEGELKFYKEKAAREEKLKIEAEQKLEDVLRKLKKKVEKE